MKTILKLSAIAISIIMAGCGNEEPNNNVPTDNEQNKEIPGESQNDLKVTINADGTTSNGISFVPINDTSFYLDHVKYQIEKSHLEVTGYDAIEISEAPKIYGQVTYRGIAYNTRIIRGSSFAGCEKITSIIISKGITVIGRSAFYGCSSLSSISLPNTLESIELYAFDECTSLKSIIIPESVTDIGNSAFHGCSSLNSISLPKTLNSIDEYAFYGCSSLSSISLPKTLKLIEPEAFRRCSSLESIVIPESVTKIYFEAFYGCHAIKSITCLALTPPDISYNTFEYNVLYEAIVYVPTGCAQSYEESSWGNYFYKNIEEIK